MENIQTGYTYIEENDLYLAVSINVRELSPEIIRAYNYCQEFNALSVKLNVRHLMLEAESLNISFSSDYVSTILAEHAELEIEVEVEKSGRTTLLFLGEQHEDIGYIVLFDGFEAYDSELGCQPVKFSQTFTTNLTFFTFNHLVKKEGDCVVAGSNREEILKEIILSSSPDRLSVEYLQEMFDVAMSELDSGLTVAEAVAEAKLHLG